MKSVLNLAIAAGIILLTMEFAPSRSLSPVASVINPQCTIKGNISHNSGRKLYHLPGMEDYQTTVIDKARGEKWFCTESDAIAKGWQKAPR